MAKFNSKTKSQTNKTTNLAGGKAFKETPKLEIVSILLTSFLQNQFYKSEAQTSNNLKNLIANEKDKKFIAKAAIYARNTFGMRSITHLTAGEIVNSVQGEAWVRKFVNDVVKRPDDMAEILSYYINNYGDKKPNGKVKHLPHPLQRGLADAFSKFNEYQLAKYKMENKDISLIDIVNMVHPKPTEKNSVALEKLVKGELKSFDTWETKISAAGVEENVEEAKNLAWKELLSEKKMGLLALIRNVRNIIEQAPDCIDMLCEALTNEEAIKKSLLFPFQINTAFEQVEEIAPQKVKTALNKMLDISCKNVPVFEGKTLIVLDESGSMEGKPFDIGSLFASMLLKSENDCDLVMFSDVARMVHLNTLDSVTTLRKEMASRMKSCGTNFPAVFNVIKRQYDRMIFLSDMQGWMGRGAPTQEYANYVRNYGESFIYSWDLQGYGTLQFPQEKIMALAGFSDKVFSLMEFAESDKNVLLNEIEKIEI